MDNLKNSNAAYSSYILVSFVWYTSLFFGLLLPVFLILTYTGNSFLPGLQLNIPISTDVLQFSPESRVGFMTIDSAVASIEVSYLAENYPGTFLWISILALAGTGLTLFGLYQLRALLKTIRHKTVFNAQNTRSIKYMSIVILLLSPGQWMYHLLLIKPFSSYMNEYGIELNIGSADFGFITTALLIYILALVFEKGYEQYEELKLKV